MVCQNANRAIGGLSTQTWMGPRASTASAMTPATDIKMSVVQPICSGKACHVRKRQMNGCTTIGDDIWAGSVIFMRAMPMMNCFILEAGARYEAMASRLSPLQACGSR